VKWWYVVKYELLSQFIGFGTTLKMAREDAARKVCASGHCVCCYVLPDRFFKYWRSLTLIFSKGRHFKFRSVLRSYQVYWLWCNFLRPSASLFRFYFIGRSQILHPAMMLIVYLFLLKVLYCEVGLDDEITDSWKDISRSTRFLIAIFLGCHMLPVHISIHLDLKILRLSIKH